MECLAEQLIAQLNQDVSPSKNVFDADVILVQSPGMAQWVKLFIAQHLGVAANLSFPLPSSFIWDLYRQHIPNLPEQSAFSKDNIAWKIMRILPTLLGQEAFLPIRQYLSQHSDLRLYQLCQKIADVYDQYLVYRPDWILAWEEGHNDLPDADVSGHAWQPILWRALVNETQQLGESHFHRANLHQQLLEALSKSNSVNDNAPLYVFGISALPQQQLEVLAALAQHREVIIYWTNPSQHYWGDIVDQKTFSKTKLQQKPGGTDYLDVGNPLLSSWGKLGRDYQDMLLSLDIQQHDHFIEQSSGSMLDTIQFEMFELLHRGSQSPLAADELLTNGKEFPKYTVHETDNSVQLHACHSKIRELEVLHDHLLHAFNSDADLSPGDIIIMMPDVASYAPFIDGVFGASERKLAIPYAISDRNLAQESALLVSFMDLMALHASRLPLSLVLSLLEVPAIQGKFDISLNDFEYIKHWLMDSGIRWGWDGEDKSRWGLPNEPQFTWDFGLKRLLAGYALNGQQVYHSDLQDIAPYSDIEGSQAQALGKFYLFSKLLKQIHQFCLNKDTLANKVSFALAIIEQCYDVNETDMEYVNQLRQTLEGLNAHALQYGEAIEQDVFVAELEKGLGNKGVGQRFLAGFVNFCTLMPMRSIPFKHVCLLGMNDGEYPRQTTPMGFDLMRMAQARRGDRSRRFDDRYLFLEAISSARKQLFISYQGYSQKDNSLRNPSVLISEFLDYCSQIFCLTGDEAIVAEKSSKNLLSKINTAHPLQPFSELYFTQNNKVNKSFQSHWLNVAINKLQPAQVKPFFDQPLPQNDPTIGTVLDVNDLLQFFNNPSKAFFNYRWQTNLQIKQLDILDEEPFAVDPLSRYQLLDYILQHEGEQPFAQAKAQGLLPIGNTAKINYADAHNNIESLQSELDGARDGQLEKRLEIDICHQDIHLTGYIDGIYGTSLVLHRPGKMRGKDKLELWLKWLCLCANHAKHGFQQAKFIAIDQQFVLQAVAPKDAQSILGDFLTLWQQGLRQPIYFYPNSAFVWIETQEVNKTMSKFNGDGNFSIGEKEEPHIARLCPQLTEHFEAFCQVTETLLSPIAHYVEGK